MSRSEVEPTVVSDPVGPITKDPVEPIVVPDLADTPSATPPPGPSVVDARRRSLRRWALAAGCLVCIAVAGAGLTSTSVFHAKTITVEGERHLSERRVQKVAGVRADTNVFRLDEGRLIRRLERDPWVLHATVSTRLPSTIHISVIERSPVAVALTGSGRVLVARDGTPLGSAPRGLALPEVRLVADPGQQGPVFDAVATGADVAGALPRDLRLRVNVVLIASDASIVLELVDGVTVTYGTAGDLEAKSLAIRAIVEWGTRQGQALDSIDVTAPGAPTARFVGASEPVPAPSTSTSTHEDRPPRETASLPAPTP